MARAPTPVRKGPVWAASIEILFSERRSTTPYERDSGDDHQDSSDGNPGPEVCSVRQRRQQLRCGSDVGTHGHSCKVEFGSPWSLRAGEPSVCASTYKAARYAYTCIDEKESDDPSAALASELEARQWLPKLLSAHSDKPKGEEGMAQLAPFSRNALRRLTRLADSCTHF